MAPWWRRADKQRTRDDGRRNNEHKSRATARARNACQHNKGSFQAKKQDRTKKHDGNKKHDGHGTGPKNKKTTKKNKGDNKTIKIVTPQGGAKHHTQQES